MYLTDYRERSLKDVITQLEPGLFKKVTGLDVNDFNLLCSIGVFNASLMNDAIFKFKRYEDSSLSYTGIEKSVIDEVGGWDTVIRRKEYEKLFFNQQATMQSTISDEITVTEDKPKVTYKIKPYVVTTTQKQEAKKEKSSFDYSRVVVGLVVIHAKFGEGTVTNIDKAKKYVKIKFAVGEKMFIFDAFEKGFLKIKQTK